MKYVSFWVFPRSLGASSRLFGTLYRFHLQRQVNEVYFIDLPLKMETPKRKHFIHPILHVSRIKVNLAIL
jgi:hypothetical protein